MNKADCFHLGYIAKLHGYKGEVSLFLDVTNPADYAGLDAIFIEVNQNLTPFFIESIKLKPNGFAAVKLEGVSDENAAKKILRNDVYLPEQVLPELSGVQFYDHEVVGFKVVDQELGDIGVLELVIDLKVNPLLQVFNNGKEILIPFREGVVTKVDRKNKELHVITPEGLVELYMS